jgi:hypothetical protein
MSRAFITYIAILISAVAILFAAMYVYSDSGYRDLGLALSIGGVGVGAIVIGIAGIQKERRELAMYRELSKRSKVRLPVTEIRKATSEVNEDTTVHVIVCRVLDRKGKLLSEFTSAPLKKDPSKILQTRKEIDVYVDPCDVKNYYMDVSFL